MKKINSIFKRNEKGSMLLTVVSVLSILTIFVMATLTVVAAAQRNTFNNYQEQQAYYTARSGIDSMLAYLSDSSDAVKNAQVTALLAQIPNSGDSIISNTVEIDGMGTYQVTVRNNGTSLSITSESQFGNAISSETVYLTRDTVAGIVPFSKSVEAVGGLSGAGAKLNVLGDVMSNSIINNYEFTNTVKVTGAIMHLGDMSFKSSGTTVDLTGIIDTTDLKGKTITTGNDLKIPNDMTITSSMEKLNNNLGSYLNVGGELDVVAAITIGSPPTGSPPTLIYRDVDVYCGLAKFTGSSYMQYGNFYTYSNIVKSTLLTGDVSFDNTDVTINGSMYVQGNLSFYNGKIIKISGDLVVGGILDIQGCKVTVGGNVIVNGLIKTPVGSGKITDGTGAYKDETSGTLSGSNPIPFPIPASTGTTNRAFQPKIKDAKEIFNYTVTASSLIQKLQPEITNAKNTVILRNSYNPAIGIVNSCDISKLKFGNVDGITISEIIINCSTTDIFIYMPDGFNIGDAVDGREIIINNTSDDADPHFVYFIGDQEGATYTFNKISVLSGSIISGGVLSEGTRDAIAANKIINLSDVDNPDPNWYSPKKSKTYFVFPNQSKVTLEGSLLEGGLFGIEIDRDPATGIIDGFAGATLEIKSVGSLKKIKFSSNGVDQNPSLDPSDLYKTVYIGAGMFYKVSGDDGASIAYKQPFPNEIFENPPIGIGGVSYKVDHYSRF